MKFRVFISGNQTELKEERFAVKDLINDNSTLRDCFDIFLFEDLPAKGGDPVSKYLKEVESSSIYIGILGNKYGIKGKDGLSPTEKEFQAFISRNTRNNALIFIKNNEDSRKDEDMQKFIENAKKSCIYKRFNGTDDLKFKVLNSLISCLDDEGKFSKEPFDDTIRMELNYDSIDEEEVRDFLTKRAVNLDVDIPKISEKNFLINILKVIKEIDHEFKPTNTGLLFFGKNPYEYIPQNEIRIARFKGVTRLETIDSQEIKGPLYKMLDDVEIFFKRNTRLANKIVDFKRVDIPEYPYEAIREALINSIVHRDYTRRGAPIMFSIFDDRVEISNPGGLLPGLDLNNLEGHHETRNEKICAIFKVEEIFDFRTLKNKKFFKETKDMEKYGTGIHKMKESMVKHGLNEPEFLEEGDFFVAKFYGPGENILDLVPNIPDERITDLKELKLNNRQIIALEMMVNEGTVFTNKLYQEIFKVSDRTASRDLKELLDKNQVYSIGKRKNRKYKASLNSD